MTTPALYLIDDAGDLATYTGPLRVAVEGLVVVILAPDGVESVARSSEAEEFEYPCGGDDAALALRDAIVNAITRAALAARPCCVVDMRDLDGAKAEASRRARVERDRAAATERGGR